MGKLKITATINCDTCGCELKRVKSITVSATNMDEAKAEANVKIQAWRKTLTGKNCKVCQSIIDMKEE